MLISRYRGYGGHEIVINNLCKGLLDLGHEVCIGAFKFEQDPPIYIRKLEIGRFSGLRWLRNAPFDIYHSHQTQMNYYSLLSKKPFVFHFHGASSRIQELNVKICMGLCKNKISRIICVSKTCLDQSLRLTKHRAEVIYNGVDTSELRPDRVQQDKKGDPQLLFVGMLYAHKNVGLLVHGMKSILNKFPKANLQIIGSGEDSNRIEQMVNKWGLNDAVDLIGTCSAEELKLRISSCDIYVSASKWEMFGLPVLEAMAYAKPVLLSDIPAHKELVEASQAGLIFPLGNSEIIAEKISEIYSGSSEFSHNARSFAERCDWSVACNTLSKIYGSLFN